MHALILSYGVSDNERAAHAELCEALAPAFAAVRGLVSLHWLVNPSTGRFGAFYVFDSKGDFDAFVAGELFANLCSRPGLEDLTASDFVVNRRPTAVTGGTTEHLKEEAHA